MTAQQAADLLVAVERLDASVSSLRSETQVALYFGFGLFLAFAFWFGVWRR